MKKRVLSGIRATGRLHLGNYLGAVKGMLKLQSDPNYETFYMVADVHSITTPFKVEELRQNRREVILDYLAAGLDPEKSVIFQQSEVGEHLELAFYFSSVMTIARMQHLPTFKEKVKQYPQHSTMALLNYPVLMAADILSYKADSVPVGVDQEPHLEVAREIARKMNSEYGLNFPEPKTFKTEGEYIPSLTGEGKMSKTTEGSYINLTDSETEIKAKVAKIPTDEGSGTEEQFEKSPVFTFVRLFMPDKYEHYKKDYLGDKVRYSDIKPELSKEIFQELEPIQKRRKELEEDPEFVDKIIAEGNIKARDVASITLAEVRSAMGLM